MKTRMTAWMGMVAAILMVSAAQGVSYNPELFTIAQKGGGGMYSPMAGNFFVWQDMMSMVFRGYDLTARASFPIATSGAMNMAMNETFAVWSDSSMTSWSGFELATKRRFTLAISDVDSMSMRLTGQYLIYRDMMDMVLHGVDLKSGQVFDITTEEIDSMSIRAAGDFVIWGTMTAPVVLGGYQLSTRQGFVLSDTEMIDTMNMAMNDQYAAWMETPADPTEAGLFCFDLAHRVKFRVTDDMVDTLSLKIGGQYIVWRSMMSQALFGFDCISREEFEIAAGNVDTMTLILNERYALWRDMMNSYLYGFDLTDRRLIETGVGNTYAFVLSDSILYWYFSDIDTMTNEVRGFDLATGTGFSVAPTSSAGMMAPLAEGDYVVWTDSNPESADMQILGARIWTIPNDTCEDAAEVATGVTFVGDSSEAVGTDMTDCGDNDRRDVWFVFKPALGGEYTIDAHSDAFDTTLAAFASCTGTATACNDDASLQTTDSQLVMTMTKGKRYLFRVAGFDGSGGPYAFTISRGNCKTPPTADLNGDCKVNMADLAILSSQWLSCGLDPAELCNP